MSRRCAITGKKPLFGNNVSHANNHVRRRPESEFALEEDIRSGNRQVREDQDFGARASNDRQKRSYALSERRRTYLEGRNLR